MGEAAGGIAIEDVSAERRRLPGWLSGLLVLALIYLFLLGIKLTGVSFKLFGDDFRDLVRTINNPMVGLFAGILLTAIARSSSLTTSLTVALVAGGEMSLAGAIPIIMGSNIGTSLNNTLVSLMHVRRRDEFRRAFAGAIVHDLFNWCTVLLFFPLEWITRVVTGEGYLQRLATWLTGQFIGARTVGAVKPFKYIIDPVAYAIRDVLVDTMNLRAGWAASILITLSLALLVMVLIGITVVMRAVVAGKVEVFLDRFLFRNAMVAYLVGMTVTAIVQSSSVTTSLVVPLLGAGLLTIEQVYPYTIGANVGTTITAFLASLAVMSYVDPATGVALGRLGFTVALVHLLFNLHGALVFYPLRALPIGAAKWYANLSADKPRYAAFFIIGVFFVAPTAVILLMQVF